MGADKAAEITPNAPNFICPNCLPKHKSLGFRWKKASLGVRCPCPPWWKKNLQNLPDALCKWGPGHADLKTWRPHQLQRWRKRLDHFRPNLGHLCRDLTTEGRITDLETNVQKNSWKYNNEKSLGGIKCISSTTPTMMIMMWYFDIAIFVMCPRTNQMIAACYS